jgi:hypothetical protein
MRKRGLLSLGQPNHVLGADERILMSEAIFRDDGFGWTVRTAESVLFLTD